MPRAAKAFGAGPAFVLRDFVEATLETGVRKGGKAGPAFVLRDFVEATLETGAPRADRSRWA